MIKMYASGDIGPNVKLYVNPETGRAGPNETGGFVGFSGPDVMARDGELFDALVSGDRPVNGAVYIDIATMAREKTYTEQQIKAAFWREFHKCGVMFFDYTGSDHGSDESTHGHWQELLAELQKELDE